MKFVKWFILFIIAAGCVLYYKGSEKKKQRIAEQEYQKEVAMLENFKVQIPELPPKSDMDFPDEVISRLHKSVKSSNANEAGKAMEILWSIHDGEVIPVMNRYLTARMDLCFDRCEMYSNMKDRIMNIITRDICQLNFDFLRVTIKDRNKDIRIRTINKLAEYPTEESMELMKSVLNDKDSEVRTVAIDGYTRIQEGRKRAKQEKLDEINHKYKDRKTLKDRISPEAILDVLD